MSSVKPDDLLRYVAGEVQDADELDRIEAAIDKDPALAAEYDQLDAAFDPAPDVIEDIREMFETLDASVWARLQYCAEPVSSGVPAKAGLELPDGQMLSVTMRTTANGAPLDMSPQPLGWRAASIALFHPRLAGGGPMAISGGEETRVLPVSRAAGKRSKQRPVRAQETALQMRAEHEHGGWTSELATNAGGAEAWLKETAFGVELFIRVPQSAIPATAARFRLQWKDASCNHDGEEIGSVPLVQRQGGLVGREKLKVGLEELRKTPRWCLRVEPVGDEERLHLDASRFRSVVGDDFQTLLLTAAAEPSEPQRIALSATLQNDRQRAMWNDRGITRWVRFERA